MFCLLQPQTLIEKAEFYVLTGDRYSELFTHLNVDDESPRVNKVEDLGKQVARDENALNILLPKFLVNTKLEIGLSDFGRGLAQGENPLKVWNLICEKLLYIEKNERDYQLVKGFLNGLSKSNPALTNELLDQSLNNELLSEVYPCLQASINFSEIDADRIIRSLKIGKATIESYNYLAYGRIPVDIADEKLVEILKLLCLKEKGLDVAIKILSMRLFGTKRIEELSEDILSIGQEVIGHVDFDSKYKSNNAYDIGIVIEWCYKGESAENAAYDVIGKLYNSFINHKIEWYDYPEVLPSLMKVQPKIFLNVFLSNDNPKIIRLLSQIIRKEYNILSYMSEETIIDWLECDFEKRALLFANFLIPYKNILGEDRIEWQSFARYIFEKYSQPKFILDIFTESFFPSLWSGSYAENVSNYFPLITELKNHINPSISRWAFENEVIFEECIRNIRKKELSEEQKRNERFE